MHFDIFFCTDIYEKAKKKITLKDLTSSSVEQDENSKKSVPGYSRSEVNDEIGESRNHTEFFRMIRTNKMEHYAAQTNNLIIRLEKLLLNLPSDPVKRKGGGLFHLNLGPFQSQE